jgi:putative Holliday junction resolvase
MRILGVDPGQRNIGIAISDPSGVIANPVKVIKHTSRSADANLIVSIAMDNDVRIIVIGQSLDDTGKPTLSGRQASRLAGTIRSISNIQVILWDEFSSTSEAKTSQKKLKTRRYKRNQHVDEIAATIILQSYLDSMNTLPQLDE